MKSLNKNINQTNKKMELIIDELIVRDELENTISGITGSTGCTAQGSGGGCGAHNIGPR